MMTIPWALLLIAVLDGLVGSAHCIGMCGPFVHILNSQARSVFWSQFFYNFSRALSYTLAGVLLGFVGEQVNLIFIGNIAAIVGGILVVIMALGYIFPSFGKKIGYLALPSFIIQALGKLMQKHQGGPAISIVMGLMSAFLPCGLLYHAYAFALAISQPLYSGLIMLVFSLGTMPGLIGFSAVSNWIWKRMGRENWQKIMGWLMLFAGLFIIFYRHTIDPSSPENCEFPLH